MVPQYRLENIPAGLGRGLQGDPILQWDRIHEPEPPTAVRMRQGEGGNQRQTSAGRQSDMQDTDAGPAAETPDGHRTLVRMSIEINQCGRTSSLFQVPEKPQHRPLLGHDDLPPEGAQSPENSGERCILEILGDLADSLIKRDVGVKDSGKIPGLGGMLDVMDSLLFTVPVVYFYLTMVLGLERL